MLNTVLTGIIVVLPIFLTRFLLTSLIILSEHTGGLQGISLTGLEYNLIIYAMICKENLLFFTKEVYFV